MCCFLATIVTLGPRITGAIWWIVRPGYWQIAFSSWIWPLLGLIFLPWTTLTYLVIYPGGVTGFEWILVGLSVVADIFSYGGSIYGNRDRIPGYRPPTSNPH